MVNVPTEASAEALTQPKKNGLNLPTKFDIEIPNAVKRLVLSGEHGNCDFIGITNKKFQTIRKSKHPHE